MNKNFVCGDIHGRYDIDKLVRFERNARRNGLELTKQDNVIICGDYGGLWNYKPTGQTINSNPFDDCWTTDELSLLEMYNNFPWTTLFVDGNHENFDRLETYDIEEWNGGEVQKISDSVIHLMRGEVYEINGDTIFTFGGAMSTDRGPAYGDTDEVIHKYWWPQEICTCDEQDNAYYNLRRYNDKVDYIITHDCPMGVNNFKTYRISSVSNYLEQLRQTIDFKHWYCGHMHFDDDFGKISVLYNHVVPLGGFVRG